MEESGEGRKGKRGGEKCAVVKFLSKAMIYAYIYLFIFIFDHSFFVILWTLRIRFSRPISSVNFLRTSPR